MFTFIAFWEEAVWKTAECKGPSIQDVRSQEGGAFPVRTFFGQGGGGQFFAILFGRLVWTAP